MSYEVISSKLVASSYTPQDHEKVAKTFDIGVGDLLLLESPNVYGVVVGSGRSIFFAKDTSEYRNVLTALLKHINISINFV